MGPTSRPKALKEHADGVLLSVWVVPGASRTEFKGMRGEAVKVRVAAPPEGGKANAQVIKLISDWFAVPVELVSGSTNRAKTLLLVGADMAGVAPRLTAAL